jgi:glycosyltransferase involved in cell wall biosynthesis
VDDGSPDDTVAVANDLIARYPKNRIRLIRQPNGGVARARNAGIASALGRYILPLDADDLIEPGMLESTHRVLEARPDIAIAYTDERTFGAAERVVRTIEFEPFTLPAFNEFCYCSLYRREVWEAVGGYNPNMVHGHEDWDFWIGAVERGYRATRVPEVLFLYRIRPGTRYAQALEHDPELRRQLRANHPRSYRPWLRLARSGLFLGRRVRHALGKPWRKLRRTTSA